MLVSILTPSFNQAQWLPFALDSVHNQDYPSIEHIIVDGGSSDGSTEILRNASGRVRWISEPDGGQADALNKALAISQGEIIGWVNADDGYFDSRAVTAIVRVFRQRPEVNVVYGHAVLVNAEGLVLHAIWAPKFNRQLLLLLDFIVQPTAFIRRAALADGFVDKSLHYVLDYDLWLRLSKTNMFERVSRVIAVDRHHDQRKVARGVIEHARERRDLTTTAGVTELNGLPAAVRKGWKIANRLRGARLVASIRATPLAASYLIPSATSLYTGQVLMSRRRLVAMRSQQNPSPWP